MRNKSDMQTHFGKEVFKGETFCRIYLQTQMLPAGFSFLPASVNREAKTNKLKGKNVEFLVNLNL